MDKKPIVLKENKDDISPRTLALGKLVATALGVAVLIVIVVFTFSDMFPHSMPF